MAVFECGTSRPALKSQKVYDRIVEAVAEGALPPGDVLTVERAASACQTSTIPVREAFQRLVCDRILEHRPGGCYAVGDLPLSSLIEGYHLIATVAQQAISRMDADHAVGVGMRLRASQGAERELAARIDASPRAYEEALHAVVASLQMEAHSLVLSLMLRRTAPFRMRTFAERRDRRRTARFIAAFAGVMGAGDTGRAQTALRRYLAGRGASLEAEYARYVG